MTHSSGHQGFDCCEVCLLGSQLYVSGLTCVSGQVWAGSRAVDSGCIILKSGRLQVVLHDVLQISSSLLIAEVKGQGQTEIERNTNRTNKQRKQKIEKKSVEKIVAW